MKCRHAKSGVDINGVRAVRFTQRKDKQTGREELSRPLKPDEINRLVGSGEHYRLRCEYDSD